MGKNMKKVLSYALGVVLALGVGFSYAYAVGANDSNAFVTKTEWNAKVAQIEASLDNVTKTINDNNMDFVMNGPRLQAGLIDGFENKGGGYTADTVLRHPYRDTQRSAHATTRMYIHNNVVLGDSWDGRQIIKHSPVWYGGDTDNTPYACQARFAVQSKDPNIYVIVSLYNVSSATSAPYSRCYIMQATYVDLSNQTTNYGSAKEVEVTLPLSDWDQIYAQGTTIPPLPRTSAGVYTGRPSDTTWHQYIIYGNSNSHTTGNLSNPATGYVTRSVSATDVTMKFEFPANTCTIRHVNASDPYSVWTVLPKNMVGRKFGTLLDTVAISTSTLMTDRAIAKLYSPQKGCLALKSYMMGEIPILNE